MNNPIGVFDSGIGGLTVLKAMRELLPHEHLIYLGDTARVPYGNKSPETIIRYSIENTNFLVRHKVKMVVIACNTSTATSLTTLRRRFSVPIVGVIEPGARRAVQVSTTKRIGVIGTDATMKSEAYTKEIASMEPSAKVYSMACPLFVPLVEEGLVKGEITDAVVAQYLKPIKAKKIDTIVLGCTHYPLLKKAISDFFNGEVNVVDSAEETAKTVSRLLDTKNISNRGTGGQPHYFVTDAADRFLRVGSTIMKENMGHISVVDIDR